MRVSRHLATLLLFASIAAGCGSDNPAGPSPGAGDMSARLDGAAWTSVMSMAVRSGNFIAVSGSNSPGTAISMAWGDGGPGTYTIGVAVGANGNLTAGGQGWTANQFVGSGTIVVTSQSATRVAGTFSFTLEPVPGTGATGMRSVTQGQFDVAFQQ